ncbi:MAG: hypothetical protein HYV03_03165 [Deltaproteobacteria bacterium]|nr:hypothetical protein [Deltaproteobacteria bacterium]
MGSFGNSWSSPVARHGSVPIFLERMLLRLAARWRPLLVGAVISAAALTALLWYRAHCTANEQVASLALYRSSALPETREAELQKLLNNYPSTSAASIARLMLAAEKVRSGAWEEAIALLEPLASSRRVPAELRWLAIETAAAAYETGNEHIRAAERYRQLLTDKRAPNRMTGLRGAVRSLAAAGRADEARALLDTFEDHDNAVEIERLWLTATQGGLPSS